MESILTEKTVGAISGKELKSRPLSTASECWEEEDFETAAAFYRSAAEINTSVNYKRVTTQEFYPFDKQEIKA